jgi:hypothetical protein
MHHTQLEAWFKTKAHFLFLINMEGVNAEDGELSLAIFGFGAHFGGLAEPDRFG